MIYDAFCFNDELDLLELRLETLDPVVDAFIICEIPFNFRMGDKPMVFAQNQERFVRWAEKIRYVRIPPASIPVEPHPVIEHFQRRQLERGMRDANLNDLLLIGDVDEIPNPDAVRAIAAGPMEHPETLVQRLYYYTVDRAVHDKWPGTVAFPRHCMTSLDCERIRQMRFHFPRRESGGWHFSWLGSEDQIANKLNCIDVDRDAKMHGSDDMKAPSPSEREFLRACRETGADLFGRPVRHQLVSIEPGKTHPAGIDSWLTRFPYHVAQREMV